MAFENELMARSTTSFSDGQTAVLWTYGPSVDDDLAAIESSGYFDEWTDQINKSDLIYLVGNDGEDIQTFTSVQGVTPVTTASFISAGDIQDGSVTTPKLAALAVTNAKLALLSVATGNIQGDAVTAAQIQDNTIIQAKLAASSYDATIARNSVDGNTEGDLLQIFRVDTTGGASANYDVLMAHKVRVIDMWVILRGSGTVSDTVTLQNVTTDITNSLDVNATDEGIVRAGFVSDTQWEIAASTNLRVAQVDGGGSDSPALTVFILALRVA